MNLSLQLILIGAVESIYHHPLWLAANTKLCCKCKTGCLPTDLANSETLNEWEHEASKRTLILYARAHWSSRKTLFISNIPANATQSTDKRQQLHLTKNKTEIQHDMHATARRAFFQPKRNSVIIPGIKWRQKTGNLGWLDYSLQSVVLFALYLVYVFLLTW